MKGMYWAISGLSAVAMICVTVLIALDKPPQDLNGLVVLLVLPAIQLLTYGKIDKVEKNTNGHMTRLMDAANIPPTTTDETNKP